MDTITVNEKTDAVNIVDQEDGVPVRIIEEQLDISEFADSMKVETQDDHVVITGDGDNLTIKEHMDVIQPQLGEVFVQNKVTTLYEDELPVPYNTQVDFVGDDLIYKGWAQPGSLTNAPVWRIQRLTFTGADDDLTVEWADGDGEFDNIWDNRAGLTYS